jgi:hypothetical protein
MGVSCGVYSPRRSGLLPVRRVADNVASYSAGGWPGMQSMMAIEPRIEIMYDL